MDMYTETGVNYQYAIVGYTYYRGKEIQTTMSIFDKVFVGFLKNPECNCEVYFFRKGKN